MKRRKNPTERQAFIAEAVERVGVTKAAFARLCGVPDRTLRSWLDRVRDPSPEMLERVAVGLEVHAESTVALAAKARQLAADPPS